MIAQPKIMVLDPAGNMWGSERVLLDFLGSSFIKDREVALCCPPSTPLARAATKLGVAVYPFFKANLHKKGKFSRLQAAIGLLKSCFYQKTEVIYVNQAGATRIALLVGRLLKIPVIPHVRLLEDVEYIESLNVGAKEMPQVLVISKYIADAFTQMEIIRRVQILYDAYKIKNIHPSLSIKLQAPIKIGCAGRLVPIKGQDVLINSIANLTRAGEDLVLNLYGNGLPEDMFESNLRKLVEKEELSSKVLFHGYIEDVSAEMSKQSIVICPSHTEPLGRIIFEAWDVGCLPIVGAFSGGAAEIIKISGGGVLYDEQTPESLAKVIKRCLNLSSDEYEAIVDQGRQWLKENCDPEEYSKKMIKILGGTLQ
jgi:glycosyltransferase involved in cell wall biosynthesis